MGEPKHQRWLTESEIQAICQALKNYQHMLNSHDLEFGSTYFKVQAEQRERAFNNLIDRIENGEVVKGVSADNSSYKEE